MSATIRVECDIVRQILSVALRICDMAVAGIETKCFRKTRSCDMNEFVNVEEVENGNGRGRVKVVKIRIDSGTDKQN